jgi:hypothetical protein
MNIFYTQDRGDLKVFNVSIFVGLAIILIIAASMYIFPKYGVWKKELSGQAQLREAEWNRQIQVREAEANLESEKLNAQSEVERAKGMAEAIQIEGGALTTEYIQYLWVRQNIFNDKTTIYIPTEANLPILEAIRLNQ